MLINLTFVVTLSYLIGSISPGLIIGNLSKKIDIRKYGSGSTGATNVIRTCGLSWGILVFALDILKATIPIILTIILSQNGVGLLPIWSRPIVGIMVMVGHIWPIYTKFNGGKGIAVGLAVCFMLSPISGLAAIIIALPLIFITKYVSLGSIAGSISSGIVLCYLSTIGAQHHPSYCIFAVLGPALAILLHKSNIINLINGQERKFGDRTEITRQ